jgi:hypothetical protein
MREAFRQQPSFMADGGHAGLRANPTFSSKASDRAAARELL